MDTKLTWRLVDSRSWESDDWRWTIVSNAAAYPDTGDRTYSVRDNVNEVWLERDFPTFEAAAAECERIHRADLLGLPS